MEYKVTESGHIALSPTGPVVIKNKDDVIIIPSEAHAEWLLERNAIYPGGEVRETKDITQVETKTEFPLKRRNKKDLIKYARDNGVDIADDSELSKKEILAKISLAALEDQAEG